MRSLPYILDRKKLVVHEQISARHIIIIPLLKPSKAPEKIEYAVLGKAGITTLINLRRKIPKGAHIPSNSTVSLIESIPMMFVR